MDIQHPKVQLNNMTSSASILLAIISCFVALVQSYNRFLNGTGVHMVPGLQRNMLVGVPQKNDSKSGTDMWTGETDMSTETGRYRSSKMDSRYFRIRIGTFNPFEYAPVQKSPKYPGYYCISTVYDPGVSFKFGDDNILIDQDQQKVIVDHTGEVRIASASEVATPGFFFDKNDFLKLQGGGEFYLCDTHRSRIMALRIGYQKDCLKVAFYKSYVFL